jgi:uncharacterized protein YbjT (DUF2867 family)
MTKPIIVVFAATGKSGSGMIDAILEDKEEQFAARAVTRNPNSDSAQALAARGVEVVQADLNDPVTLAKVMDGAHGVFGVTDFWQAFMAEEQQGKDMVDAAQAARVKHFVWTTLDHSKWEVPHFETKARVNDYLKTTGLPHTSLYLSFFIENFGSGIRKTHGGKITFESAFPTDGKLPVISAFDIGYWALAAFKNPDRWINQDMKVCTEIVTPRQVAQYVEEASGHKVNIHEIGPEEWKERNTPQFSELWKNIDMFNHLADTPGFRDIELSNKLVPNAKKTKGFVTACVRHLQSV